MNALSICADDKLAVSASKDNTIKLWELHTGKELATICVLYEKDWIIYTHDGCFDASKNALDLIFFKEWDKQVKPEPLMQKYRKKGLLLKILKN